MLATFAKALMLVFGILAHPVVASNARRVAADPRPGFDPRLPLFSTGRALDLHNLHWNAPADLLVRVTGASRHPGYYYGPPPSYYSPSPAYAPPYAPQPPYFYYDTGKRLKGSPCAQ